MKTEERAGPSSALVAAIADPRTGVYENESQMRFEARVYTGDEVRIIGWCGMNAPIEARREWEKQTWHRFFVERVGEGRDQGIADAMAEQWGRERVNEQR